MRLLVWKLFAVAAVMTAAGCNLPRMPVTPQVTPDAQVVEHKLTITVDGEGKINVGGDASITAKVSESAPKTLCPCCGATGSCQGLCGKPGCVCSRGSASAAPTVGTVTDLPQFVTQTQKQYQCRNGVCGWYDVEVRVPVATAAKRSAAAVTPGGKITIYENNSPACRAMRAAIGTKGVDWERGNPPATNGLHWWPTAVKPDGSTWTPGHAGWHAGSLSQFEAWRDSP